MKRLNVFLSRTIAGTTLLVAATGSSSANILLNGDFSSGNSGFTSGYTYSPGNITPETTYDVVTDPKLSHSGAALNYWDHTSGTGTGNMLAVNGATTSNVTVWSQTVSVAQNTVYGFEFYMSHWSSTTQNLAHLNVLFNGISLGVTNSPTTAGYWQQFLASWDSGAATSLTISMVDLVTAGFGNDFALDDFSLDVGQNTATLNTVESGTLTEASTPSVPLPSPIA